MKTLIFDFRTKTVGVAGGSAVVGKAYEDIVAAQRKLVANSPATASQPRAQS